MARPKTRTSLLVFCFYFICLVSVSRADDDLTQRTRTLQADACTQTPLIVAYGGSKRPVLAPLIENKPPVGEIKQPIETLFLNLNSPTCDFKQAATIPGTLVIWDDGELPVAFGSQFSNLERVGGQLIFFSNDAAKTKIKNMVGFNKLREVNGNLVISRLHSLESLAGLSSLQKLGADLSFQDVKPLSNLTGIGKLETTSGDLYFDSCAQLTSLSGLETLKKIGWNLYLRANRNLESLKGLENVASVGGEITSLNNVKLQSTAALKTLQSVGISIIIANSPLLEDIEGLSKIKIVDGDLQISGCHALKSLQALGNIESIKLNLVISDNNGLLDLTGLDKIASVGYLMSVSFNRNLQSLKGLKVQSVGQDIYIRNNDNLTNLQDLAATLQFVGEVGGGNVIIEENPLLNSLGGLNEVLVRINGGIRLRNNGGITLEEVDALKAKSLSAK